MSYIGSTLINGEEILLNPKIDNIVHFRPVIFFVVLTFLFLLVGLIDGNQDTWMCAGACIGFTLLISVIWYLIGKLYYNRIEMAVTNKRVVCKTGIISVHSEELQWNKIESIEIRQGIIGRLCNYGDIYFSGTGTSYVRFGYVNDPWKIKSQSAEILSN